MAGKQSTRTAEHRLMVADPLCAVATFSFSSWPAPAGGHRVGLKLSEQKWYKPHWARW